MDPLEIDDVTIVNETGINNFTILYSFDGSHWNPMVIKVGGMAAVPVNDDKEVYLMVIDKKNRKSTKKVVPSGKEVAVYRDTKNQKYAFRFH
ncbi:hypothetical protein ACD591_08260 [Rufibacter glacialis]|uniref:Uncharacterized protein n=1 Tax=Rufibacter glacialis TaxID=1259555 RepID=A0A5M8QBN7_9BACT|nr:hypothetical protein [Rufibacter glacialis]KAA6432558.1 hypothetical protein FOE74_15850 [Rufibacter glacialis]GGK79803.1 hypothetical protein GCM10011405_29510 [Rufibacter glacialis]